MNENLSAGDSGRVAICAFCHKYLNSNDLSSDRESSICGDCKFLFLEDFENPVQEGYRTPLQSRRRRFSSNGSFENLFLQQSPQWTSPATQIQAFGTEYGNDSIDGNASVLAFQSSSRTTPSGSRRWRSLSRTESEMYDSDSSLSFGVHVWDSDVSVDDNSFLENELSPLPVELRDAESDTDIDPMNAGFYSWDSDDPEEADEAADNEWEGMDAGNDTFTVLGFGAHLHRRFENNVVGVRRGLASSLNVDLPELVNYNPIPRDSIGTRVFNELIESLARNDDSRIGAPPASVSFVDNLPQIVIREDLDKLNDFSCCAICKDSLPVGTVVNQLPCSHMYHSNCILPWLSTRNSCPLCRYELPTDDTDYEEKKQRERRSILNMNIITEQDTNEEENDDSSAFGDAEADFQLSETNRNTPDNVDAVPSQGGGARRCFFLAAAPVVGIVSIVLMFCFGNSVRHRRWSCNGTGFGAPG